MFEGIRIFLEALGGALFDPRLLFDVFWATLLGITVGMLPGLTATMGVALMATLTFNMPASNAIQILVCMYIGAIYGGSRTAILLNIPGTPANAAASLDGFPLAKQGLAGRAIGIATTGSFLGSMIGMVMLAFFTPIIGNFALSFQSFEFFWLSIFGIVICGSIAGQKDPLKGWISGFLGLFVATIGLENMHAYGRFCFDKVELFGGINLIPAMVGAFGFSEVIMVMKNPRIKVVKTKVDRVIPRIGDITKYWKTIIRSGILGSFIGAVPGIGEVTSAWFSYDLARRSSKEPETFGKGSIEGLLAAETGDNACVPGAMIPVLSLAIPGSAPAAILLAAMILHGIRPGPLIMIEYPEFIYQVVAMVFLATVAIFILGLSFVRVFVKILYIPRVKLMTIVFILCVVGSFAIQERLFDVGVMMVFGIIGYYMREMEISVLPMCLGIVLGQIFDANLRRSLIIADGNPLPFFTRPISIVIVVLILLTILSGTQWFKKLVSSIVKR